MNVEMLRYATCYHVSYLGEKKNTKITIETDVYELPFVIPTQQEKGRILFDKVSTYVLEQTVEDGKVIKDEATFCLYCIELYKDDFNTAMEEFEKLVTVSNSLLLKDSIKDVIIKAFFNIIDISNKSYNKAYNYIHHAPYAGFQGSFRQFCGLE